MTTGNNYVLVQIYLITELICLKIDTITFFRVCLFTETTSSLANMGIARCNLRLGNIRQGLRLANEIDEKTLYEDCGDILDFQKQYSEAAAVYIKAGNYERAGHIYIKVLFFLF